MTALRAVRTLSRHGASARDIRWLLGRIHVGTPDADVRHDILRRTQPWPLEARDAAVAYALAVHRHNRRTYRRVMLGEWGVR